MLSGAPSAHAAATATATKAIDWLEGQMAANGHHLKSGFTDENNQFQTFDDPGLTIDGLLGAAAAGRAGDAEATATSAWMADNVDNYVSFGDPNTLFAGALGKSIVYAVVYDKDFNHLDGHDLEADLRGRQRSNGRFTDKSTFNGQPSDFSNGITQALDVLALAATDNGAPTTAVNYLLLQQCANGGFRETLGDTKCADNSKASADATSFALMALDALDSSTAVDAALDAGADYLASVQATSGAFTGAAGESANSTGLAGSVLRGLGDAPRANKGATFVKSVQLTTGDNAGAILGNKDDYDDAVANGLDAQGKTLAARATAQGVLALGLPTYPRIGIDAPVEPATTEALSSSSVPEGGTVTVSGGGFATGEKVKVTVASDPVTVGEPVAGNSGAMSLTFTLPASIGAGSHTVTLLGESSGVTISAPLTVTAAATTSTTAGPSGATTTSTTVRSAIVRTGSGTGDQAQIAVGLVALGGALLLATRRRRIVYPFHK